MTGPGQVADGWVQGDGSPTDRVWLADWRRRVAALYAEVRAMAATDPAAAHAHWRAVRERLYREHPQSPVPVAERESFQARHFDYDARLRFEVTLEPAPPPAPGAFALALPNSGPDTLSFSRVGTVSLPLPDGPRSLSVFWMAGYAGASSSRSVTRRTAPRRTAPVATSLTPRRVPTLAATPRAAPSGSMPTSPSSPRARSTRAGRAPWRHPRIGSTSPSARANASPELDTHGSAS